MSDAVCLDASVLVQLYAPEPATPDAHRLMRRALTLSWALIGPVFMPIEVLSALRRRVHQGTMSREEALMARDSLFSLRIKLLDGRDIYERAWQIAEELSLPVLYDSVYLSVCEVRGAIFWTADQKLFDRAKNRGYLRLLGHDSSAEAIR